MIQVFKSKRESLAYRVLCSVIVMTFVLSTIMSPQTAWAQLFYTSKVSLPIPGVMIGPSSVFTPAMVRGIQIHPEDPLKFDFIIDRGDADLRAEEFRSESIKLIKYFLAALTTPEDQMWVNLSPDEPDRIVPKDFGQTEMGRDLLAQDYILKQMVASLTHPDGKFGKELWEKIREGARVQGVGSSILSNPNPQTLNPILSKIWIVPEKAFVYEHQKGALVVSSHLKVMLEEDYLQGVGSRVQGIENKATSDERQATEFLKEILIPEIEKEVNEGETFANLRQIYNSMILAVWYKNKLKDSVGVTGQSPLLSKIYVDKNKNDGVDHSDSQANQKIYAQYLEAFKTGVYDFIKEDYDPETQEVIARKYFSGGATSITIDRIDSATTSNLSGEDFAAIAKVVSEMKNSQQVTVALNADPDAAMAAKVYDGDVKKLLDKVPDNAYEGWSIARVARDIRLPSQPVQRYLSRNRAEVRRLGIKKWGQDSELLNSGKYAQRDEREQRITTKLKRHGSEKLAGKSIMSLAKIIDEDVFHLYSYFNRHPDKLEEYQIVKNARGDGAMTAWDDRLIADVLSGSVSGRIITALDKRGFKKIGDLRAVTWMDLQERVQGKGGLGWVALKSLYQALRSNDINLAWSRPLLDEDSIEYLWFLYGSEYHFESLMNTTIRHNLSKLSKAGYSTISDIKATTDEKLLSIDESINSRFVNIVRTLILVSQKEIKPLKVGSYTAAQFLEATYYEIDGRPQHIFAPGMRAVVKRYSRIQDRIDKFDDELVAFDNTAEPTRILREGVHYTNLSDIEFIEVVDFSMTTDRLPWETDQFLRIQKATSFVARSKFNLVKSAQRSVAVWEDGIKNEMDAAMTTDPEDRLLTMSLADKMYLIEGFLTRTTGAFGTILPNFRSGNPFIQMNIISVDDDLGESGFRIYYKLDDGNLRSQNLSAGEEVQESQILDPSEFSDRYIVKIDVHPSLTDMGPLLEAIRVELVRQFGEQENRFLFIQWDAIANALQDDTQPMLNEETIVVYDPDSNQSVKMTFIARHPRTSETMKRIAEKLFKENLIPRFRETPHLLVSNHGIGIQLFFKPIKVYVREKGGQLRYLAEFSSFDLLERGIGPMSEEDASMTARGQEAPGGIDLNPDQMDIEIKNDGKRFEFDAPAGKLFGGAQDKALFGEGFNGFTPVIINIQPIVNLPLILGLADPVDEDGTEYGQDLRAREVEKISLN